MSSICELAAAEAKTITATTVAPKTDKPTSPTENTSGWRNFGHKLVWKPPQYWNDYDRRMKARAEQQKITDKARRRRKQRNRRRQSYSSRPTPSSSHSHNTVSSEHRNHHDSSQTNGTLDKILLAAAKTKFSGPYANQNKPIDFNKGETINPYSAAGKLPQHQQHLEQQPHPQQQPHQQQQMQHNEQQISLIDPMRPPIVRLTEMSANGDGRFLKARLRNPKIMHIVRLYLAYLHDAQTSACVEGMTKTSVKILLAAEGLPTETKHLQRIFIEVHQELGMDEENAIADLRTFRSFLHDSRIQRLQAVRESTSKFMSPTPSRNNTPSNFHRR